VAALGQKYEPPDGGSVLRPKRRRVPAGDRCGMAQMIVAFLGTTAWVGGVLVLLVMALVPLLENLVDGR
jgi:hypothetical protein